MDQLVLEPRELARQRGADAGRFFAVDLDLDGSPRWSPCNACAADGLLVRAENCPGFRDPRVWRFAPAGARRPAGRGRHVSGKTAEKELLDDLGFELREQGRERGQVLRVRPRE